MTKRELIDQLEALDCPDETPVGHAPQRTRSTRPLEFAWKDAVDATQESRCIGDRQMQTVVVVWA